MYVLYFYKKRKIDEILAVIIFTREWLNQRCFTNVVLSSAVLNLHKREIQSEKKKMEMNE